MRCRIEGGLPPFAASMWIKPCDVGARAVLLIVLAFQAAVTEDLQVNYGVRPLYPRP